MDQSIHTDRSWRVVGDMVPPCTAPPRVRILQQWRGPVDPVSGGRSRVAGGSWGRMVVGS